MFARASAGIAAAFMGRLDPADAPPPGSSEI